jgi:phosphatidate cytidylyltransferase
VQPRRVSVDAPGDDDEPYSETSSAAHAAATDAAKGSRAKGSTGGSSGGSTGGPLLADADDRWRKAAVRTVSTVVMLGGFVLIFSLGHVAVGCLVLLLQGIIFNEIVGLRYARMQEIGIPHFRFMTWYFYLATVFYAYGRVLHNLILETFGEDAVFLQYHDFASFVIYVAGILAFILNLRKGLYRQQFGQFAWTHMTLLLVVVQSTLMLHNIFAGLIWFLLPCLLVITNDIFGFISGFFFGRTPLIKLSPKKTWEGFIGALIGTRGLTFFFFVCFCFCFVFFLPFFFS